MKKVIIFTVSLLCAVAIFVGKSKSAYPEKMIYNYMTSSVSKILTATADDYFVALDSNRKMLYDKNSGNTSVLSQGVFDITEQNTNLIAAKNNLLYYIATDNVTGGSAIYEFDLKSLKKRKIDSVNKMSDPDAFLGIDSVLGIDTGANDMMSLVTGDIWFNKYGRHSVKEIRSFLNEKDTDNKFFTDVLGGVCTTDEYIFFINGLFGLCRYSYADDNIKCLTKDRVTDFFITESNIYYYSADKGGVLLMCDYNGESTEKITDIIFTDIHLYEGTVFAQNEEGNIYHIDGKSITKKAENVDTKMWAANSEYVYIYDSEKKTFERV